MKVFGTKTGEISLLVDGNYVINGHWTLTISEDGKEGRCLERGHRQPPGSPCAYFIADVPPSVLKRFKYHDYNGIMAAMDDYLKSERKKLALPAKK